MTILTFGQAARLTSLGKTTLARAIKSGRLGRVYPFPAPVEAANATNAATNDHAASLEVEIAALRDMAVLPPAARRHPTRPRPLARSSAATGSATATGGCTAIADVSATGICTAAADVGGSGCASLSMSRRPCGSPVAIQKSVA